MLLCYVVPAHRVTIPTSPTPTLSISLAIRELILPCAVQTELPSHGNRSAGWLCSAWGSPTCISPPGVNSWLSSLAPHRPQCRVEQQSWHLWQLKPGGQGMLEQLISPMGDSALLQLGNSSP